MWDLFVGTISITFWISFGLLAIVLATSFTGSGDGEEEVNNY